MIHCKICSNESHFFDKAIILNKYEVSYYLCPHCGFVQTEEPYWLSEAYSDAIADNDIDLIHRNIMLSEQINNILKIFGEDLQCLDFGGGYGMFVRLMRNLGWDFEWYDKYCTNLFAKHHEMQKKHYDIVTFFEVLEHLPNPLQTLEKIFNISDTLICSTYIISVPPPKISEWNYYTPESGQHISFYARKSLQVIADKFNKNLYAKHGIIIFSNDKIPSKKINLTFNHPKLARLILPLKDRPSLLAKDYYDLTGRNLYD